ncbi:MAG TPA: bis(5'-nucleosyl)-tetraphosphatase (symmetrical) YqeK [Anaerolineales bacterium]|nr:bis(5'-nucleosyl)-tetraphosphatase (symmetrical) YqeK [Anaerolineales bacterium]
MSVEFIGVDVDQCIRFVKHELTPQRFKHSLGVMDVMSELAPLYGLDQSTAVIAGILHDSAKELAADDLIKLANKNGISLRTEYDKHPLFLHGPVSACYITQELGITDPIVLDTISRHSYFGDGAALSPSFCWCLRFADMLEPSRNWEDLKNQLRPLVYSGKLGEGAYTLVKWIIPFHESLSLPVHLNIRRLVHELSILMNEKNLEDVSNLPV